MLPLPAKTHIAKHGFDRRISLFCRHITRIRRLLFYFYEMATVWYKKKWVIVLLHMSVWALLFLLPLLLQQSLQHSRNEHTTVDRNRFIYLTIVTDLLWVGLFYFNAFVLIPNLVSKKKMYWYVLIQLGVVGVLILCHWLFFTFIVKQHHFDLNGFFSFQHLPLPVYSCV